MPTDPNQVGLVLRLLGSAPLSKSAGGAQACSELVYKDTGDPDYKSVRDLLRAATDKAWQSPRRDLQTLAGN